MSFNRAALMISGLVAAILSVNPSVQASDLKVTEEVLKKARPRGFDTDRYQRSTDKRILASAHKINRQMRTWFSIIDLPAESILASDLLTELKAQRPHCLVKAVVNDIEAELSLVPLLKDRIEVAYEVFESPRGFFMAFKSYQGQEASQIERNIKQLWAKNAGRMGNSAAVESSINEHLNQIRSCDTTPVRELLVNRAIDFQVVSELNTAVLSDRQLEANLVSLFDSTFALRLTPHRKNDWSLMPELEQQPQDLELRPSLLRALWKVVPAMAFDDNDQLSQQSCERVARALSWVYMLGIRVTPDSVAPLLVTQEIFQNWAQMQMALVLGDFERLDSCTAALRALEMIWPHNLFPSRDLTVKNLDGNEATIYDFHRDSSVFFARNGYGGRWELRSGLGNQWSVSLKLSRPERRSEKLQIPKPAL